jgi:hypothetical protein
MIRISIRIRNLDFKQLLLLRDSFRKALVQWTAAL